MMDYPSHTGGHRSQGMSMSSSGGSSRSGGSSSGSSRSSAPSSSSGGLSRTTSATGGSTSSGSSRLGGTTSGVSSRSSSDIGGGRNGSDRMGGDRSNSDLLNGPPLVSPSSGVTGGVQSMFGYEPAGGPRFDMSSDFPALGGDGHGHGGHGHHMGLGGIGSSHHGLGVHHGGDPRDFGADDFPALSSPSGQHGGGGGGGGQRSIGSLDLSSLHAMAQTSGYMGGDENGYDYHSEHSRTFPGHAAGSTSRSGRAPPPGGLSRSSAPSIIGGGASSNGLAGALPGASSSSSSAAGGASGTIGGLGSSASSSRTSRTSSTRPTRSSTASPAGERFGLRGLLGVIRMTDPDLNTLALGTDLTTLGLNLNSTEVLYATFAYPSADVPTRREPDYVLPYCYYMQPPALKTSHLSKFKLETLFYIFYNMPKDLLQIYAAKELYNREWRYHKELKLWFTRPSTDVLKNLPGGAAAAGGSFVYFDINSWERRLFRDNNMIPGGAKFMTEEEHSLLS